MRLQPASRFWITLALAAVLAVSLSACLAVRPVAPTPTRAPAIIHATDTPEPTTTPMPTETPQPSLTPTVTPTLPPTATYTPTPDPALEKIKLIGLGWYPNYDLLLSFEFPGPVDPVRYRVTLEDKPYKCEVLGQFPNRLYCRGQGAKVLAVAHVRVYPVGSDVAGFEKEVWVPYFDK